MCGVTTQLFFITSLVLVVLTTVYFLLGMRVVNFARCKKEEKMAAAKSRKEGFMVPELRREREASKLDISELTTFVDGGEMITGQRKSMCECFF